MNDAGLVINVAYVDVNTAEFDVNDAKLEEGMRCIYIMTSEKQQAFHLSARFPSMK